MNGDDDQDTVQVNGSSTNGDHFAMSPGVGGRVAFTRTNFGVFTLDISAEDLAVNGGGGDEIMTGTLGLRDLITLTLSGEAGNDKLTGGDGPDLLNGGPDNDTLIGFRGGDLMVGGPGLDTLIWNNGDGSDVMNGEGDEDTVQVNGSTTAGDHFLIGPGVSDRVAFTRTSPGPFTLDISAENLQLNGLEGSDIMTGSVGLSGRITMTMNGGPDNDTLTGGDGADTQNGNEGDDTLIGFRGNDLMNGGPGVDRLIWNNGDGSDIMNGDEDADTVEVNGSNNNGDAFEVAPAGARVAFSRTNLGPFTLDISGEALEVNGGGGDDAFLVIPLPATTVQFNGGDSAIQVAQVGSDVLTINAQGQTVVRSPNQVVVGNNQPIGFADVEVVEIINALLRVLTPVILKGSSPTYP
jgi:Ca2+-binding RTX toxin-like protein